MLLRDALGNIKEVVDQGLCTGCGTCSGICPVEAVEMHVSKGLLLPRIDEEKCTCCDLCVKCCPGYAVDFEALNSVVFGVQPKDAFLGNYLGCYVGHSNDYKVRFNSSSGGVVTQLLVFALDKGLIDGAVVTRMRGDSPLLPESFIARTKEEIVSASKSKYCPTSTNEVLKQILKADGKFAFVGLPCQIHGVRKAEMNIKGLKEKIILRISLFCSHNVSFHGTEFLLKKLGLSPNMVLSIAYRGRGWPGSMVLKLKGSPRLVVPYSRGFRCYWPIFSCYFFTPLRCLMCWDCTGELADISVGDAWLREFRSDNIGSSIIITRTKLGEDFLSLARSEKKVFAQSISTDLVRQSQRDSLKFKKDDLAVRLAMIKAMGWAVPNFKLAYSGSLISFLRNFFVLRNVLACRMENFRCLLIGAPFPLFRLYYGVYKVLSLI
jgi:coenzyme F420 hydrogenase subunit beta